MSESPKTEDTANLPVFVTGSTMRHVITMTSASALGLVSIFFVDILNLFYISLLGEQELTAAVGYASTVMFFTVSISIGFTIAATAIIAKGLGEKNNQQTKTDAGATLIYIALINTVVALVMFPLLGPILSALGASGRTHAEALVFMQIVTPVIPFMGVGMCASGLLRAKGDARRAMYVTLSAGIVAAIMDPLLILYFDLGVRGAAISTMITRIVLVATGFYGIWTVHRMIAMPNMKQLTKLLRPYLFIAIPALLTQIATPVSNAYMTSIMSEFGDGAVTGWAIISRLVPLAFVALLTLSAAVGPILAQNLGAQRFDRITMTMRDSLLFMLLYTVVVCLILALFANDIVQMFGLSGEGAGLVRFFCLFVAGTYLFQGGLFVANAAFNNLGYPFYSTLFNWGRATIGTIPFAYFGAQWGAQGAVAGFGIGGIFFGISAVLTCFWIIKKLPEKIARERQQQERIKAH